MTVNRGAAVETQPSLVFDPKVMVVRCEVAGPCQNLFSRLGDFKTKWGLELQPIEQSRQESLAQVLNTEDGPGEVLL